MTIAKNKENFARLFSEVILKGNIGEIDTLMHPNVRHHQAGEENYTVGTHHVTEISKMLQNAFPDLDLLVEDMIGEEDQVWARLSVSGTHHGPFFGISPTGKSFNMTEFFAARFSDGLIVEFWTLQDQLTMHRQLGLIPSADTVSTN